MHRPKSAVDRNRELFAQRFLLLLFVRIGADGHFQDAEKD
jgi:hypothetical protein